MKRRRGREVFHQMCSMLKGTSSIAEQYESSMDTASELIHELSSCTDGKRLAMDASAFEHRTHLVDNLPTPAALRGENLPTFAPRVILSTSAVCRGKPLFPPRRTAVNLLNSRRDPTAPPPRSPSMTKTHININMHSMTLSLT